MYVFTFGFWLVVLALAAVHARSGVRIQRWLLLNASVLLYAAFDRWLVVSLAWVVCISWVGVRARHYTDDVAMLRFVRIVSGVATFVPLLTYHLLDGVLGGVRTAGDQVGLDTAGWTVALGVPIGVAFYTLQAVDAVDAPASPDNPRRFLDHALFVSFFPTAFLGPVHRPHQLMPQLTARRRVTRTDVDAAALLVCVGAFHKLVVADNLLPIADRALDTSRASSSLEVAAGALAFGLGLFADLSGHLLALTGVARLFGIRLEVGTDRPWLATGPIAFWDRLLPTVTDWFLRRVFLPLRGTTGSAGRTVLALGTTFLAAGVWFGASAPLMVWAGLHWCAVLLQLRSAGRRRREPSLPRTLIATAATTAFVTYGWIWFNAATLGDAVDAHRALLRPGASSLAIGSVATIALFAVLLVVSDLGHRALASTDRPLPVLARGLSFAAMIAALLVFSTGDIHTSVLGLR